MASFLLSLLLGFAALSRSFPLIQVPNQCTHHPFLSFEFPDNSTFEHSLLLRFLHSSLFCYIISAGSFLVFRGSFSLCPLLVCCFSLISSLGSIINLNSSLFPSLRFASLPFFSLPFPSLPSLLSFSHAPFLLF